MCGLPDMIIDNILSFCKKCYGLLCSPLPKQSKNNIIYAYSCFYVLAATSFVEQLSLELKCPFISWKNNSTGGSHSSAVCSDRRQRGSCSLRLDFLLRCSESPWNPTVSSAAVWERRTHSEKVCWACCSPCSLLCHIDPVTTLLVVSDGNSSCFRAGSFGSHLALHLGSLVAFISQTNFVMVWPMIVVCVCSQIR